MGAFDSIRMGHRCKDWLLYDPPSAPKYIASKGTGSVDGQQWVINATEDGRIAKVQELSQAVLDGGPRWVLSTALGFDTGGLWWTVIYTAVFAIANYAMYVNTKDPSWISGEELAGIVAYAILAVVLSVASVPGGWRVSEWTSLVSGLAVEVFLCVSVVVSVSITHDIFSSALGDSGSLSLWADAGRWSAPGLVWVYASRRREQAERVVQTRLSSFWSSHPVGNSCAQLDEDGINTRWNDWSQAVMQCARRVGGHGMLGFSAHDVEVLFAGSPTPDACRQIQHLHSSLRKDGETNNEPWVRNSLAFFEGYRTRLVVTEPERSGICMTFDDVRILVTSLMSAGSEHADMCSYRSEIESSRQQAKYTVMTQGDDDQWFFAGALVADSDSRARTSPLPAGSYGSRLAVAISIIAKGTDPLARLACYPRVEAVESNFKTLESAIHASVDVLVSELASSAGVAVNVKALGRRGVAYVEGVSKILSYSPDELVAALHREEVFVITEDTFSSSKPTERFESLWGGSENVQKRVDVSDMEPNSGLDAGANARRGWMCHFGFTLAILMLRLCGGSSKAVVVLLLVAIPATDKRVSAHIDSYFFMIYISYLLNYTRLINRWASLAQRGQATLDKSDNLRKLVFLFVNILPVAASYVFKEKGGWAWWVAFIPCVLANSPGVLNTVYFGWASAFEYECWSWHLPNRWFEGRGYLRVVELRERVGRNVLAVLVNSKNVMSVEHVTPKRGKVESAHRFVVVGGGRLPAL